MIAKDPAGQEVAIGDYVVYCQYGKTDSRFIYKGYVESFTNSLKPRIRTTVQKWNTVLRTQEPSEEVIPVGSVWFKIQDPKDLLPIEVKFKTNQRI
jgi:hypothetical protein